MGYFPPANISYMNDLRRGRLAEPSRFYRIEEYAQERWRKSKKPQHYSQWQRLLEAVKKRKPY